ncbi:MAG TPA: PIN domain-containing protein [Nostocaceae cyanobacterium]|nr:PIN domain-containing protein [Nostocaceae cyanobacterium]
MLKVVLDACVLFPMYLRDTLLSTAEAGLYMPYWSQKILDEAMRNLVVRGKTSVEKAKTLEEVIKAAFPESMLEVPTEVEAAMTNHPKDRHVLAAAVIAQADIIVTNDIKGFNTPLSIRDISPDDFLCDLYDANAYKMIEVIYQQAHKYKRSPRTYEDLCDLLSKQTPKFSEKLLTL